MVVPPQGQGLCHQPATAGLPFCAKDFGKPVHGYVQYVYCTVDVCVDALVFFTADHQASFHPAVVLHRDTADSIIAQRRSLEPRFVIAPVQESDPDWWTEGQCLPMRPASCSRESGLWCLSPSISGGQCRHLSR